MRLKDRVSVITGAGQGIGRAVARKMAAEGSWVVLLEWNRETGGRVLEELKAHGHRAMFIACDVADRGAVEGAVQEVLERWGRLEVLVNNAGFDRPATLLKVTDEDWEAVLGVHLRGTLNTMRAVIPHMVERSYGKIVNVSSIYGKTGAVAAISYSAAKAGILGLTKSVAREVGKYGINVNAVLPGLTATPTIAKMPEKYKEMILRETPLGRIGEPEEVANVIAFLASDEASFMTGACVEVSGGWRM
ncbi:MAG: SDR family NAD(P)-dependent oxidoreductase [Thermodesulfobacteriota bacterium]